MSWRTLIRRGLLFIIGLTTASFAIAQGQIDDRGHDTVNHNYFAAGQDDSLKDLLINVRSHHLKPCPHGPGGAVHDIAIGRYDLAQADLTYLLDRFVNDPVGLQLITPIVIGGKHYAAWGIERFEYALKWYPNYPMTHAQYGAYLAEIGSVQLGIEKLQIAIKMDPRLVAAYVWLSKAYAKHGDTE